jgi:predicted nucleic acid-binding protein
MAGCCTQGTGHHRDGARPAGGATDRRGFSDALRAAGSSGGHYTGEAPTATRQGAPKGEGAGIGVGVRVRAASVDASVKAYFETSAIVKLVLFEQGWDEAGEVWGGSDQVLTSPLAYAETRAAIAAARRARRISADVVVEAKRALDARFLELDLVEVSQSVVLRAGDLAEKHGLGGFDAVHLSSAAKLGRKGTLLVTWDRQLARAGREEGLEIAGASVG